MFVVVDFQTRCKVSYPRTGKSMWETERAAKAAATRMSKMPNMGDLEIMDVDTYRAQVPMREVTNLMTGKKVQERADTPWHCSVASETYWSA